MKNLEIKAVAPDLARHRRVLRRLGAKKQPLLRQTDWYFKVPAGRLKLRAFGAQRSAQLIVYFRPDKRAARTSDFQCLPVRDQAGTRRLLAAMFGLSGCVRKQREVWLLRNARIHLDRVADLGTFLEIEVVVSRGAKQAAALMGTLRSALKIEPSDLIAGSYIEMRGRERT